MAGIDQYTQLMLHFDNNFKDSSQNNYSVTNSGVAFSNSIYKFRQYPYSAYFNGSASLVPGTLSASFGTADFAIDMWVNTTLPGGSNYGIISNNHSSAVGVWKFFDPENLQFGIQGAFNDSFGVNVADGNWHLIEVDRHLGVFYYFSDGVLVGTDSSYTSQACGIPGSNITIGSNIVDGNIYYTGYIDELRITVGTYRHITNYIPPTSPYNSGSGFDALLLSGD